MDNIATIKTFCSGPTGTNEMLESMKGHNGAWGGNVDMNTSTIKGWGTSSDIFCCICKAKVEASKISPTFWTRK